MTGRQRLNGCHHGVNAYLSSRGWSGRGRQWCVDKWSCKPCTYTQLRTCERADVWTYTYLVSICIHLKVSCTIQIGRLLNNSLDNWLMEILEWRQIHFSLFDEETNETRKHEMFDGGPTDKNFRISMFLYINVRVFKKLIEQPVISLHSAFPYLRGTIFDIKPLNFHFKINAMNS